ncbi:MAG: hypothetical protein OQK98_03290 [Gammaproteobacteria bacterium]|nr:hypothetical protein [Gammaproteobacteria bacterium]
MMNAIAIDVTEAGPDRRNNVDSKTTVTPVLEKNIGRYACRDDISATLNCESIFDFQLSYERTALHSEHEGLVDYDALLLNEGQPKELPFDDEKNDNENRITLLARKYATKNMSTEDSARLDILTQRFRDAMPALAEKDLEIMEHLNKKIETGIELSNRLKKKYK